MSRSKDLIKADTRVNLLGNKIVLIAPKDSKATRRRQAGLRSRQGAGRRQARHGQRRFGAGRQVRQGGAREARRLGRREGPASRRPRTCARRSCWWRAARRRSASSTRPTPPPSRTSRSSAPSPRTRHPPIIYPAALTKDAKIGRRQGRSSTYLQERQGAAGVREAGLHGSGEVRHLDMTPEEWTAVRLSLLVAVTATAGQPAVRHRHRLAAGARPVLGQEPARHAGPPAADPAAGGDRLPAADPVRPARADRRLPRRAVRHRLRLPLDRRGAGLRGDGLSADGARHPALDRGGRHAARERGGHAGRQPALGVRHHHPAALPARRDRRRDPVLRQVDGRVRRHHHLRVQHPGRDADPAVGDLHPDPDAGRRRRRAAAHPGVDRDLDGGPARLGAAGAPHRRPAAWRHEPRGRRRPCARHLPSRRALHRASPA